MIVQWLLSNWLIGATVGVVSLAFVFPAVSLPTLRWLLLTERGRILLIVCAGVWGFLFLRNHYLDAGYSRAMAEQARKADRAKVAAAVADLNRYMEHAAEMAAIEDRYEKERTAAVDAAITRLRADVSAGRIRLREPWREVPATASTGERNAAATSREAAAERIIRIGAQADAQLRACQAVITADRK